MLTFSSILQNLRKTEGKTQQDIAQYIGISTAAVSKWETGQSYPDIMTLPKLATFFNISIDEMLGYEPQMSKEDIQKLYKRLSEDFQRKPFDEVFEEIQLLVKEYYACFPLLLQLVVLLLNYSNISAERTDDTYEYMKKLCIRIEENSKDPKINSLSRTIQAQIEMMMQQPQNALDILGEEIELYAGNNIILASAYILLNKPEKAEETYQISLFQDIISTMSVLSNYIQLQLTTPAVFQSTVDKALGIIDLFDLEDLHTPSCLNFYLSAAQGYAFQQNKEACLHMLDNYRSLVEHLKFPLHLHGNEYFNKIDSWLIRELDLGQAIPTDEETVRQNLFVSVKNNPYFQSLQQDQRFLAILQQISHHLGVK